MQRKGAQKEDQDEFDYFDVSLYFKEQNALLLSDIHIGIEESLRKTGIHLPLESFEKILKRTSAILGHFRQKYHLTKFKKIIILGDLKHEFGTISQQEWSHTLRYLDFLAEETQEMVLLKGNHDTVLQPILDKRRLEVRWSKAIGSTLLLHGDILPEEMIRKNQLEREVFDLSKTIIIGHEHPAVSLRHAGRAETYKCFLKGTYGKKTLIVLPSLNPLTPGTDILRHSLLSPFLQADLSGFFVFVVEEKTGHILDFGTVKKIGQRFGE